MVFLQMFCDFLIVFTSVYLGRPVCETNVDYHCLHLEVEARVCVRVCAHARMSRFIALAVDKYFFSYGLA